MKTRNDLLREGKAVDFGNGVKGRLNREKQALELSNGTTLPLSDSQKREFIPQNESELKYAKTKEKVKGEVQKAPAGEFFHQVSQSGGLGGIKDLYHRYTSNPDEYLNRKQAEAELSRSISKKSPLMSGLATAASFVPDIALTSGMSAAKAAPLITAVSAGSRVLDEPLEVAKEAAISSAGGFLLDKGANFLKNVAARRGASRALPAEVEAVQQSNRLGAEATAEANALQNKNFFESQNKIKAQNESLLSNHEADLLARKNKMIENNNAYQTAKINRETAIGAQKHAATQEERLLKEQYSIAQKEYDQALKSMPSMQKKAQQEYSSNVVRNAEKIQKSFPKDSKIYSSQIGVDEFIENSINKTGLAASKEANQTKKILKSLFPEGEALSSKELSSRYHALENAIQKGSPEAKSILNEFKNHLGSRMPVILEDSITYQKVMPLLKRYLEKDVINTLQNVKGLDRRTIASIRSNALNTVRNIHSENFVNRLQNGEVSRQIVEEMAPLESFVTFMKKSDLDLIRSGKGAKGAKNASNFFNSQIQNAEKKREAFIQGLTFQLDQRIGKYEIKAMEAAQAANKKLGTDIKGTFGTASAIPEPLAPAQPQAMLPPMPPPEIAPPPQLPIPSKPNLIPPAQPPTLQSFNPMAEPSLPPAQGIAQRLGDVLEKPIDIKGQLGNLTSANASNPLLKLGALKYLLGKAAIPAEVGAVAGYGALKGLTAPGAQVARQSFKMAGIAAIEAMAQKYPSYQDGILQSPQDRRSLTKEIEDDPEIPAGEKAVIQSKVNRGKRLNERLN